MNWNKLVCLLRYSLIHLTVKGFLKRIQAEVKSVYHASLAAITGYVLHINTQKSGYTYPCIRFKDVVLLILRSASFHTAPVLFIFL